MSLVMVINVKVLLKGNKHDLACLGSVKVHVSVTFLNMMTSRA